MVAILGLAAVQCRPDAGTVDVEAYDAIVGGGRRPPGPRHALVDAGAEQDVDLVHMDGPS